MHIFGLRHEKKSAFRKALVYMFNYAAICNCKRGKHHTKCIGSLGFEEREGQLLVQFVLQRAQQNTIVIVHVGPGSR